ncbi:MAG TPA: hypothetical protein VFT66_27520 [Roseiflexaceae bacterium]|nr:hypothetical protein [Roseiflexaceae bacterium]
MQRFASGDYATRVDVHRMADTIQRTTMHLATQYAAAETARADAEAARAEVAQQLDTIQAQPCGAGAAQRRASRACWAAM